MPKYKYRSIKTNMILSFIKEMLGILFPIVTTLYVVRTLGKDTYGHVHYIRSIVSYFSLLAGLGTETYGIREGARVRENRNEFERFVSELFTINTLSTCSAIVLLFLFISWFNKVNKLSDYVLLSIFCLPIVLSVLGRDWINIVYEDYLYITVRYIITFFLSIGFLFVFVKSKNDFSQYAFFLCMPTCAYQLLNIFYVRRYCKLSFSRISACKKHIKSVIVLFSSTIASTIYLNSDTTLLGFMVNDEAVATYAVASQVYVGIKQLTGTVIGVTIPRLSFYVGNNKFDATSILVSKLLDYAIILLIPSMIGLIELSKPIMLFMGGEAYLEGISVLYVFAVTLIFAVLANILARCIVIPFKEDKLFLNATIISALVNIGLNLIFIPRWSYLGAAITTFISEVIVFLILLRISVKNVKIKVGLKSLYVAIIGCIPIIITCEVIKKVISNTVCVLILSILLSVLIYYCVIALCHHPISEDIKSIVMKSRSSKKN